MSLALFSSLFVSCSGCPNVLHVDALRIYLLSTQVPSAPAFPIAHLLLSLMVLPHSDGPIHFPFGEVLMLLLQTSTILTDKMELKFYSLFN